jgi:hypothetical protein
VNAPPGYRSRIGALPPNASVLKPGGAPAEVIQVFVKSRAELEAELPKLKRALAQNGLLWVTYAKGTSKMKGDINRDSIAAYARTIGMEGVSMISIDDDWSALRLKVLP